MAEDEIVVEYKGFLLIQRVYPGTTTSRIRRPDGTWRDTEPTIVCSPWSGWVVARRSPGGVLKSWEKLRAPRRPVSGSIAKLIAGSSRTESGAEADGGACSLSQVHCPSSLRCC